MIRDILLDDAVRKPSVHVDSKDISSLIQDMIDTCRDKEAYGLAASQIGVPHRLFISDYSEAVKSRRKIMVWLNPEIIETSEEIIQSPEACLSLPEQHYMVPRYVWIKVRSQHDRGKKKGKLFETKVKGFLAAVIQHEMDHLEGTLIDVKGEKYDQV